ncbi:hypothetical protein [Vibrio neonatus]|uniref:hypothetical protein n=1 Tax=Vibrio neonatus TaxID=278860 RepID=UPI0021C27488|nr:hypothetical protein [Vibrio neonatus]
MIKMLFLLLLVPMPVLANYPSVWDSYEFGFIGITDKNVVSETDYKSNSCNNALSEVSKYFSQKLNIVQSSSTKNINGMIYRSDQEEIKSTSSITIENLKVFATSEDEQKYYCLYVLKREQVNNMMSIIRKRNKFLKKLNKLINHKFYTRAENLLLNSELLDKDIVKSYLFEINSLKYRCLYSEISLENKKLKLYFNQNVYLSYFKNNSNFIKRINKNVLNIEGGKFKYINLNENNSIYVIYSRQNDKILHSKFIAKSILSDEQNVKVKIIDY